MAQMITDAEWEELVGAIRNPDDLDAVVTAAERIHNEATANDVPRLKELLRDADFFVREAAAWPLSELAGSSVLTELLKAYQQGLDEGQDNDFFTAALLEMVEADRAGVRAVLESLAQSTDPALRDNAAWLLTFCESEGT